MKSDESEAKTHPKHCNNMNDHYLRPAIGCRCPYAVLNLSGCDRHSSREYSSISSFQKRLLVSSDNAIRDAYKKLSRIFHPDKWSSEEEKRIAQEMFIELINAYEILIDPVLRQTYDHFGHSIVAFVREHRYDSNSLYKLLSNLHDEDKADEALEILQSVLENIEQSRREREWQYTLDVSVNLHANIGSADWVDVSETDVHLTAFVPKSLSNNISSSYHSYHDDYEKSFPKMKQKMQLSIGAKSALQKGTSSTYGIVSTGYHATPHTNITSDLVIGRNHFETSLSSSQKFNNGTMASAKIARHYELRSGKEIRLEFSSHRSLSLFHSRPVQAMFAFGMGINQQGYLQARYGVLSFETFAFGVSDLVPDEEEKVEKNDDFENKSQNSQDFNEQQEESSRTGTDSAVLHSQFNPPRISAKLAPGTQFPMEVSVEKFCLFKSPFRSGKITISYNPLWRTYQLKGLLSRELSAVSSLSIGMKHNRMKGLSWFFRYQRHQFSFSVPIFVSSFLSTNYWKMFIWVSSVTFLIDETIEEFFDHPKSRKTDESNKSNKFEIITIKSELNLKEQHWMSSLIAKENAHWQLRMMEPIAKANKEYEESINGLVILKASYSRITPLWSSTKPKVSTDVTQQLQFWVRSSCLILPANSKSNLLGFYELGLGKKMIEEKSSINTLVDRFHRWVMFANTCLTYFGIGRENYSNPESSNVSDNHIESAEGNCGAEEATILAVRYKYRGIVYEYTTGDDQRLELPNTCAFNMGCSDFII